MSTDGPRGSTTHVASRKRKDRESSDALRAPPPKAAKADPASASASAPANNLLLAGYLAHEFLTKGTLLGRRLDNAGRPEPAAKQNRKSEPIQTESDRPKQPNWYADVALLLKTDGIHVPGVVNPTQMSRLLQM